MRHLPFLMAALGLLLASQVRADSESFTLSTGYNETSFSSEFNRGTALQARISRGDALFAGSFDSHGQTSLGMGYINARQDMDRDIDRYPMVTFFARPGEGSGVAFELHQDWYWRGRPSQNPGKYLTLFHTQAGVVCQEGELPKVRVTQRFVSSQRRFPARTQGVEWVWEFRQDYPTEYITLGGQDLQSAVSRRSMRLEHWAFFSRELGFGVLNLSVGATHKSVFRQPSTTAATTPGLEGAVATPETPVRTRIPVLMGRVAFTIRRW
ncbi:MAG TPA: hypothetical protein VJY35_07130 [Candidatus Eisenbacteria bacterium]|nr:hypothetical protein [Candidatus Eisenbacteria bacterium]